MKWWLLKTRAVTQLFMLVCQKRRSKLSVELQTNMTMDDPEASFVWSDRAEHDFIGKPVLDPCSKATQPNADPGLSSEFAYSWVATGVGDDDADFPCFCFSGKRPYSAHRYRLCSSLGVQSSDGISAGSDTMEAFGLCRWGVCVAAWRCAARVPCIVWEPLRRCEA